MVGNLYAIEHYVFQFLHEIGPVFIRELFNIFFDDVQSANNVLLQLVNVILVPFVIQYRADVAKGIVRFVTA